MKTKVTIPLWRIVGAGLIAISVALGLSLAGNDNPRNVNLDQYGKHANGFPVVFTDANEDLVVDCDNPRVWCDDEGR